MRKMSTYYEFTTRNVLIGRFWCAECGHDSMVKSRDRNTTRYDCAFCGWDCFMDWFGDWWHQETSHEMEEELREEELRYQAYFGRMHKGAE